MGHLARIVGGLACVAMLAGGASAQALGPGGAVIVPVTPSPDATFVPSGIVSPNYLSVEPQQVYVRRAGRVLVPAARGTFSVGTPPPGYRSAFDGERENPLRGPRTLQGDYQTDGIWTRTVPRKLRPIIQVRR